MSTRHMEILFLFIIMASSKGNKEIIYEFFHSSSVVCRGTYFLLVKVVYQRLLMGMRF